MAGKKRRGSSITSKNSKDKLSNNIVKKIQLRKNLQSEEPPEITALKNTINNEKKKAYKQMHVLRKERNRNTSRALTTSQEDWHETSGVSTKHRGSMTHRGENRSSFKKSDLLSRGSQKTPTKNVTIRSFVNIPNSRHKNENLEAYPYYAGTNTQKKNKRKCSSKKRKGKKIFSNLKHQKNEVITYSRCVTKEESSPKGQRVHQALIYSGKKHASMKRMKQQVRNSISSPITIRTKNSNRGSSLKRMPQNSQKILSKQQFRRNSSSKRITLFYICCSFS